MDWGFVEELRKRAGGDAEDAEEGKGERFRDAWRIRFVEKSRRLIREGESAAREKAERARVEGRLKMWTPLM